MNDQPRRGSVTEQLYRTNRHPPPCRRNNKQNLRNQFKKNKTKQEVLPYSQH